MQAVSGPPRAGGLSCFAYVRVSTIRQEVQGASLEAQKDAIRAYARQHGLTITRWFHESQTAAKAGRKEFARMLRLLRQGKAEGVIVHKIDRSARNLKEWANFVALPEEGIGVHFAAEALDLTSRGGRLTADIQAVVAADYIRNLRQETLKGIQARRKQGLLPCPAPVGYLNNGGGKPKTIDPVKGPLVREMFECYATGHFTLKTICEHMNERGLTNVFGSPIGKNSASKLLRQPFYTGIVRVSTTGETYEGVHEPLITQALFRRVQNVLAGATRPKKRRRGHLFSRLFTCVHCDKTLIVERQKGHTYYRCHTRGCETKCLREEVIEECVEEALAEFTITATERRYMEGELARLASLEESRYQERVRGLRLKLGSVTERIERLEDLVLDGLFDPARYREKKAALLRQKKALEEDVAGIRERTDEMKERIAEYLELAEMAQQNYRMALPSEKRELVEITTSNRSVAGKEVFVELSFPFRVLADRAHSDDGDPSRDLPRTQSSLDGIIRYLWEMSSNGILLAAAD